MLKKKEKMSMLIMGECPLKCTVINKIFWDKNAFVLRSLVH